ncbi:MAG: arginine--tRNA ligase [Candidatus Pacebacteria bacterium]|nr:arginine--tRNA ligase [Candidatus Paceibacterota bacterium]
MYFSEIKQLILKNLDKNATLKVCLDEKFGDLAVYGLKNNDLDCDFIEKTQIINNFLNIFIKKPILFESIIREILDKRVKKNKERIILEYLSPNTNKPLHVGHLRNGFLGMTLANIFKELGYSVSRINLINDRGEHICKSMLAYQKWGKGQTPESLGMKPDHFIGYWYVMYSQKETPELREEVHEMLRKWEQKDRKILALWKKMNNWVYKGFEQTYKKTGLEFDKTYYESKVYQLGKKIIEKGIKKGIFYKGKQGDVLFDLPEKEFGLNKDGSLKKITVLRKDKTSVYLTQDLGIANLKYKDFKFNKSIYVVGLEQDYYFKCLFYILKSLGYKWAEKCFHLSYGMVYLPEGKMKSREGKVIDADNLVDDIQKLVEKKYDLKDNSLEIALSAIKFNLLLIQPKQDIHFNLEKSIALEGKTGPYCQYSLVRALSILEKAKLFKNPNFSKLLLEKEIILIRQLSTYSEVLQRSAESFNPGLFTNYVYELAKSFNQFYDSCPVLKAKDEETIQARLYLVKAFSIIMEKGLNILNISCLKKM